MKWPLNKKPVPYDQVPLYNRYYLYASKASHVDPVMVMGTEIEADSLLAFLRERNRTGDTLVTTSHALVRATALALAQFPQMNVRLVGHRIYSFRAVNIRTAFVHRGNKEIDVMLISSANTKSLEQIGQEVWQRMLQAGRGGIGRDRDLNKMRRLPSFVFGQFMRFYGFIDRTFPIPTLGRLDELRGGSTMVNDLSSSGAPPMRMYKPSRFPDSCDSLNLTLGPVETKVVQREDRFVSIRVMPLFLRADHRLTDAYEVGRFLSLVRDLMQNPQRLELGADQ
ncbi:MAG: 2-oxo acid dehydrogenase subunit E2 [Xanthobacteraceae bacterium]|nr:2-oxo acid dehydrogenase subunit E2 [Xanthobacteraceae bacterium]